MGRWSPSVAVVTALMLGLSARAPAQSLINALVKTPKPLPADRKFEVMVPMRDGIKLSTLVTLPEGKGPWPVVFTRTPYGKELPGMSTSMIDFTAMGYASVLQDSRGLGESEGTFGAFQHEKPDGFDSVAWIADQPWCSGKVGMFGISAGGILANFTAMTSPPALRCCFVCVAHGCDFRYGSYNGGVFIDDLNKRWFKALGHPLAEALKPRIGVYDDLAADMDLRNHYEKVQVPIFNACGWYDIFHESGIENYEGLQARGSGLAKGNQRLLVGAFAHLPINGKISYPKEAAKPDFEAVERWFARWLKDETTALVDLPKVKYFLMGDPFDKSAPGNEWRTADHWPPESTETSFWLASGGELRQDMPATTSQVEHVYDPKNPVPTIGGNNLFLQRGPMDQRPTRSRKDVLRFESAPLIEPMTIAGRVQAMLAVSTDAMDTDFMVKLVDVYPDGYEALVLDQPMRLRFRDGLADPKPAKKGEVYRIRINLGSTALAVAAGHRIAVHVQSSNSPRYEPHTNTWDPVKSYAEGVVARQQVYLGGSTGSRIVLPVVE